MISMYWYGAATSVPRIPEDLKTLKSSILDRPLTVGTSLLFAQASYSEALTPSLKLNNTINVAIA
jgi:hypothetical protein